AADGGQKVVDLVVGAEIVEGHQPAVLRPDRNLVCADGEDVELAALGGDVGGHLLTEDVLLEGHPVQLDVGIFLGEVVGQLLHADHVAVIDRRNGQLGGGIGLTDGKQRRCAQKGAHKHLHNVSSHRMVRAYATPL